MATITLDGCCEATSSIQEMATTTITNRPTSFVPLSSIFTAPPKCSSSWTFVPSYYNDYTPGALVQNVFSSTFDTDCWPPGFTQFGSFLQDTVQIFSPGWCQHGYTSTIQANGPTSTEITCCPTGYRYTSGLYEGLIVHGCISSYSATAATTITARPNTTETDQRSLVVSTLEVSVIDGATMWAQPVTIAYQQKDLHLFTNASTSTSSGQMSTGMKIGIGVGVALASVILILLVGLLLLHRRKKQRKQALVEVSQELHENVQAEEDKKEGLYTVQNAEMDGTQTAEMDGI